MKKILSVFLCIVLLGLTCVAGFAATPIVEEKPFDNSEFFSYGDYSIHYRKVEHNGIYRGRIMMLHGFGQSTYSWENMADQMSAKGYDCYMADLPNFGYSTRECEEVEAIDRETLIVELMKSIADDGRWILAGHSMGGGVAINIAEEMPLRALFLVAPAPMADTSAIPANVVTFPLVTCVMNLVFKYLTRVDFIMSAIVQMATNNEEYTSNYDLDKVTAPLQLDNTGTGLCYMMTRVRMTDLDSADKITCPVLIINASDDAVINDEMKQSVADALPAAEHYTVEGGGHICHEDRAEEIADVVYDFLNK